MCPDHSRTAHRPHPGAPRRAPKSQSTAEGKGAIGQTGAVATPADLSPAALEFVATRHLATLTTLRPDGSPHVVPVGFTWDAEHGIARVITSGTSRKARNAALGGRAVLCQVEGRSLALARGHDAGPHRQRRVSATPSSGMPPATACRAPTPSASWSSSRSTACSETSRTL